jgi:Tol biopolymer transport system component
MTAEPEPIARSVRMTPPELDRLVRSCLAKARDERWQSAHDVAEELRWIAADGSQLGPMPPDGKSIVRGARLGWPALALALGLALAIATAKLFFSARSGRPNEALRLNLLPPDGTVSSGPFDLSPDGRAVVFAATGQDGKTALYWRALDRLDARKLPGTDNASLPFFSPDSRSVGFFSGKSLERIDLAGGPPTWLAPVSDPRGGSWGTRGVIVYAPGSGSGLYRISAEGGSAVGLTKLDPAHRETSHRWPHFLPDGNQFVFMRRGSQAPRLVLGLGSLDGKERVLLGDVDSSAVFAGGNLFFQRQTTLFAQRFDAQTGALSGELHPIADDAWIDPGTGGLTAFAAGGDGRVAYRRGGIVHGHIARVDREGRLMRQVGEAGNLAWLDLSRDGRRILATSTDDAAFDSLYVIDNASSIATRITFAEDVASPLFSPDGNTIVYASDRNGPLDLFERNVSGTGEAKLLLATPHWKFPDSWSRDGKFISYTEIDPVTRSDIWILPQTAGAKPIPFARTAATESQSRFSPDARLLAYTSDESGREEVFVQQFPPNGAKWKISAAGGSSAEWRADGSELFFLSRDSRLMSATVTHSPAGFAFGPPRELFTMRVKQHYWTAVSDRVYAVESDGQSFLIVEPQGAATASPIVMLLGPAVQGLGKP